MIVFQKLRFKNFLSYGDQFNEIDFLKSNTNLIVGSNGSGKSVFLDALVFSLYGKSFRNITKPMLVNSINQNKLVVEIEFAVHNNNFKIIRGIKPNIFEIYKDDVLLAQTGEMKHHQDMLERDILKMNYTTFTQIVVLGKASYVPFMRLSVGKRRDLIEELLTLNVFSDMKSNLLIRVAENDKLISKVTNALELSNERIKLKEQQINQIESETDKWVLDIKNDMLELKDAYQKYKQEYTKNQELADKIDVSELDSTKKKLKSIYRDTIQVKHKIDDVKKKSDFFCDNDICPTCTQSIHVDFKHSKLESIQTELKALTDKLQSLEVLDEQVNSTLEELTQLKTKQSKLISANDVILTQQKQRKSRLLKLKAKLNSITNDTENIDLIKADIANESELVEKYNSELSHLGSLKWVYSEISTMLKDGGIKSLIVAKYLPIFNKLINSYLVRLGLFVTFNLDETFQEKIVSRNKDKFSYNSFSEGEKLRIDLAIMLAWRDFNKLKSGKDCNLIIMDEIFDSSMDESGVDAFIDLLPEFKCVNMFVISHTPEKLSSKFDCLYEIEKIGNFSLISCRVVS
jgi:DNA repair exonuclease SbcCD ATPase subunit